MSSAIAGLFAALWRKLNNMPGTPKPAPASAQPPKNVTVSPQPTVSQPAPKPQPQPQLSPPITPITSAWSCLFPYEYDDAANTSWYCNFDWQKDFIGTDQSRYLGKNNECVDKLSDTNLQYGEKALKPRSEGWDNWLGDQMARCVNSGKRYIELDNADYALERDRSVVMETYKLANSLGLAIILKNPTARDVVEFGRLTIAGAVFEQGAMSPREFASARKYVVPTMQATWVRHGGNINGQDIPEIASQVREVSGTSVQWGPGEYNGMRIVASNPFQAGPMPQAAPAPAPVLQPEPPKPQSFPDTGPHSFGHLQKEYEQLLATAHITNQAAVNEAADLVMKNIARYKEVGPSPMPPAVFIGALDYRESDCDPRAGLGQGDPWNRVSTHVPTNKGPFKSWLDAAHFYIHYDKLDDNPAWSMAYACWKGESWNGWGYRDYHGTRSPYLWGGTNQQQRGKYVGDGEWNGSVMDGQVGIVAVMLECIRRDPTLVFGPTVTIAAPTVTKTAPQPPLSAPAVIKSRSLLDPDALFSVATAHGAPWENDPGHRHLFYVEGCDPLTGNPLGDRFDHWHDTRGILQFIDGKPVVTFKAESTTEPGRYYDVEHVIGRFEDGRIGAALIDTGWQACWQVGIHMAGHNDEHEALVQTGAEVAVWRDELKNFKRGHGVLHKGFFGINQHSTGGNDANPNSIGPWSAGCLVCPRMGTTQRPGHRQWMAILKQDSRYVADRKFVFGSIVISSEWLA